MNLGSTAVRKFNSAENNFIVNQCRKSFFFSFSAMLHLGTVERPQLNQPVLSVCCSQHLSKKYYRIAKVRNLGGISKKI